jgi:tetratricopeptide (TPR) repeat protein
LAIKKLIPLFFVLLIPLLPATSRGDEFLRKNYVYLETWQVDKIENTANAIMAKKHLDPDESWFVGLYYFYQGNYPKAYSYLKSASSQVPKDKNWYGFALFVEKIDQITKDFQTYQSQHFILRLDKKDQILANYALEALENGYREIGRDLKYFPDRKVLVEIYPSIEDFNFASSLSKEDMDVSGTTGICKFNRLMILSPRCLAFGFRWLDCLVHEYTHFVINMKSNMHTPLWLHEGIARYEEKRWILPLGNNYLTPLDSSLLKEALDHNEMVSFERMSPSLVKLKSRREVALSFAETASVIDYVVNIYGLDMLPQILDKLKADPNYKEAIAAVLNQEYNIFEKAWLNYIRSKKLVYIPGIIMESFKIKDKKAGTDYDTEAYINERLRGSVRLGDTFSKKGQPDRALEEYKKALVLQAYNPVVLNRVGKVYADLNNFQQAEESYQEAIRMNPNYVTSYTNLGDLYFVSKDTARAMANYRETNSLDPFNPAIHKNMGIIYYQYQNDRQKAIEEWKVAAKLDPQDIQIHGWLLNAK